eukprot:scaffold2207_cov271-Alexandrium_tamarense.AAC.8
MRVCKECLLNDGKTTPGYSTPGTGKLRPSTHLEGYLLVNHIISLLVGSDHREGGKSRVVGLNSKRRKTTPGYFTCCDTFLRKKRYRRSGTGKLRPSTT